MPLQIEAGKFYVDGDGQVYGPAKRSISPEYPWTLFSEAKRGNCTFTPEGRRFIGEADETDLVAEYVADRPHFLMRHLVSKEDPSEDRSGEVAPAVHPIRAEILREADALTTGPRDADYGDPAINMLAASAFKFVFRAHAVNMTQTEMEAIDMCLTKLARGSGIITSTPRPILRLLANWLNEALDGASN